MFQRVDGDWTQHRRGREVDFHWSTFRDGGHFWDHMAEVYHVALDSLKDAHSKGIEWVTFIHGWSTSGPGQQSARSIIRGLMRSKDSTPYVVKSRCLQHDTIFVVAIRPNPEGAAVYTAECAAEVESLRCELLELIEVSGNHTFKENAKANLVVTLEAEGEEVLEKLRVKIGNYKDQYQRRCGPWESLV